MANYAIIRTGGKQYRATPGQQLTIEKTGGDCGTEIRFDQVLLTRVDGNLSIGGPTVADAVVVGTVVQQTRDKKVLIHKHKKRKKYRVTRGHRQYITRVLIDTIQLGGAKIAAAADVPLAAPEEAAPSAPPSPASEE